LILEIKSSNFTPHRPQLLRSGDGEQETFFACVRAWKPHPKSISSLRSGHSYIWVCQCVWQGEDIEVRLRSKAHQGFDRREVLHRPQP